MGLTTGATYMRFVAEHDPNMSSVGLAHLDSLFARHAWVSREVRSEARDVLMERGAESVAHYLRNHYAALEPHGVTEGEIQQWVALMDQFGAATRRKGPAIAADFADLFLYLELCNSAAWSFATAVDDTVRGPALLGRRSDEARGLQVTRVSFASPLDLVVSVGHFGMGLTGLAALFMFVKVAFGADLEVRAHRESQRAAMYEAKIRAEQLRTEYERMVQEHRPREPAPTVWRMDRIEVSDEA